MDSMNRKRKVKLLRRSLRTRQSQLATTGNEVAETASPAGVQAVEQSGGDTAFTPTTQSDVEDATMDLSALQKLQVVAFGLTGANRIHT